MRIYKLLTALLLPGLAIFAAALAQHILTVVWPGVREIRFPAVTADGCFFAGLTLQRQVGNRSGLICAVIGRPMLDLDARIAWLRLVTLFSIATAILPLLALVLGWFYPGARRRRFIRAS